MNKLIHTAMYMSVVFYAYLIMFILMTYNFGIIMMVILGNSVGYFLFGFPEKYVRLGDNTGVCCT